MMRERDFDHLRELMSWMMSIRRHSDILSGHEETQLYLEYEIRFFPPNVYDNIYVYHMISFHTKSPFGIASFF